MCDMRGHLCHPSLWSLEGKFMKSLVHFHVFTGPRNVTQATRLAFQEPLSADPSYSSKAHFVVLKIIELFLYENFIYAYNVV